MIMKSKIFLFVFVFISFMLYAEEISFSADSMSGTAGSKTSKTVLKGNAKVITESLEIAADKIELTGKDFQIIKAEGNVVGKNTESNLDFSCQNLYYDRKTKIASFKDSVELDDADNDVKAKAEVIEYNQNLEISVMQINVNITQKNNVCTGAFAIYRKQEQLLELNGNAKVVQNDDTFRAQEIVLNLETQEITLDGKVKGSVSTTQKENKSDSENTNDDDNVLENEERLEDNLITNQEDENGNSE